MFRKYVRKIAKLVLQNDPDHTRLENFVACKGCGIVFNIGPYPNGKMGMPQKQWESWKIFNTYCPRCRDDEIARAEMVNWASSHPEQVAMCKDTFDEEKKSCPEK